MARGDSEQAIGLAVSVNGVKCPPNDVACIKRQIESLKKKASDIKEELRKMQYGNQAASIYLDKWVQDNFKTQGGNVGGWIPFKHGGRVGKKGVDTTAKLLQDTGRLRASFLPFADKKIAGIGSELPYSKSHDEGDGAPKRRILPKREEIWPTVKKIYNDFVKKAISK